MTVIGWPDGLKPRVAAFQPRGMTLSGPRSLTGRAQTVAFDAGYWTATLSEFTVHSFPHNDQNHRLYRALRAKMEGGANQVYVPVFDAVQPWPLDLDGNPMREAAPCLFDDGASFDDGEPLWQPVIGAFMASAATVRATSITIDFKLSGEITGGEYFSIDDRLHVISAVTATSGTEKTVDIWPPLRKAVADETELNFDAPICRMKLVNEESGDFAIGPGGYGRASMEFREAL